MSVSICYHCYQLLAFQSLLSYKQTATDVRWMRLSAKKQSRKKRQNKGTRVVMK